MPTDDERKWAFVSHLASALGGALAPLLVLSWKKDSPWVQQHARESFNFQLTLHFVEVAGLILTIVNIGALIFFAAWGAGVILALFGGAKAWSGLDYRYPFSIKFLKG